MTFRFVKYAAILVLLSALPLSACSPQQKETRYLQRGNELFNKGDYDKARLEYKNAAKVMPTEAEPRYRMGLVDEAQGDLRNAFSNFVAAEQQNPHFHPAVLKIAQYYMAAEQYDQTEKRITEVLSEDPNNAEAHALNAALLLRKKSYEEAEKEAQVALAKDPANVTGIAALTGIYSATNQFDKATTTINDGIAKNPQNLSLMMVRVMLFEHMDDLAKIADAYEAIFKLKPDQVQFRVDLATIYLKAGKKDEAEAVLRAGIAARPDDEELKHQLVLFLSEQRGVQAAEDEVNKLAKADPKNDDYYFWLADIYASHDATDKAVSMLQDIVAKETTDKNGLNARTLLARIDIKQGNKDLAAKLVNAVLDKDPENHAALFVRASLSFDKGAYQNSVSDLRAILRDTPNDKDALQLLGETFLRQGHLDLAIDTMKKLVELDPQNYAARVRLAQMVHISGDDKQAMDIVQSVTKTAPDYAVGWESAARIAIDSKNWLLAQAAIEALDKIEGQHLTAVLLQGMVLQKNGKDDEAIAKYKEVISADPTSPLAEHALAGLVDSEHKIGKIADAASFIEGLKSDNPYIQSLLGRCYAALGRKDDAAAAFEKAITANAAFQEPYIDRAKLYLEQGKKDAAAEVLRKATDAAPGDFRAPIMLAELLNSEGQTANAVAVYDDMLARNPGLDIAANNMAEIIADDHSSDAGQLEKARQMAERFADSKNPLLLDTLAWVYYRQDNMEMAQTVMERAMDRARDANVELPPQVHYHYGAILMKAGKKEAADRELRLATATNATYPGADEAKKLLAQ